MFKVTFFGAAQEVTGSMHLVEADGVLIALDCGLFQGRREETEQKNRRFPVGADKIHAVVLSHAHVDHCGRLPLLVKQGFSGPIYSTAATRDLAALLMADSAHIQLEDAKYINKKHLKNGQPPVEPLYSDQDAAAALKLFHTVEQEQVFALTERLSARYYQTGHMLGACMVELQFQPDQESHGRDARATSLVFSGDVGRAHLPILEDPHPFPVCDYIICESTYGGRLHPPATDLEARLGQVVNDTIAREGKVIIPAFSVGRTQVVVYALHRLIVAGKIPALPIFVDSPLAVNATEVFRLHPELFDEEAREFLRATGDILGTESCTYIRDVEESKRLNTRKAPCVIISASGMCETGRIVHHLANNIESPKNTILIVGFQAQHTLGRRLVEKQPHVLIFGKQMKLRADVVVLNGFSGHADAKELRASLSPLAATCKTAFLVHGEMDQMTALRGTMLGDGFKQVEMPAPGSEFVLAG